MEERMTGDGERVAWEVAPEAGRTDKRASHLCLMLAERAATGTHGLGHVVGLQLAVGVLVVYLKHHLILL